MAIAPGDDDSSSGVAVPGLYRSRSLPHLFAGDSGVGSFSEGPPGPGPQTKCGAGGLVAELRQLLTLKQHYYPEGGWGWVVVFCSVIVQILTHGLQLGSGVLVRDTVAKFGQEVTMQAVGLMDDSVVDFAQVSDGMRARRSWWTAKRDNVDPEMPDPPPVNLLVQRFASYVALAIGVMFTAVAVYLLCQLSDLQLKKN